MPYVTKDLDEDEDKQTPSLLGGAPGASSAPSMTAGVGGAQAQPQRNPAQKGTNFIGLQNWLDAGKGRDKAVSEKGATALGNEQANLDKATTDANASLATQNVLAPTGGVQDQLDREAGITPITGTAAPQQARPLTQPAAAPQPVRQALTPPTTPMGGTAGALAPGSVRMISPSNGPTPPPVSPRPAQSPPTIAPDVAGPSLADVLGQTYKGPDTIAYKPGQSLTDLAMLSNTGTIADVTGREANEAGTYSKYSGLRALDDALYGGDAASVQAAATNKKSGQDFAKKTDEGVAAFEKLVGERKKAMSDQAGKVRGELEGINAAELARLEKSAADENARATGESQSMDMVRDPTTGEMVPVPKGHVLGDWEGSVAGTATAGGMMTGTDKSRFGALSKLLGIDAPDAVDPYTAGRRTTRQAPPGEGAELTDYALAEQAATMQWKSPEEQQAITAALKARGMTDGEIQDLAAAYWRRQQQQGTLGTPIVGPRPERK